MILTVGEQGHSDDKLTWIESLKDEAHVRRLVPKLTSGSVVTVWLAGKGLQTYATAFHHQGYTGDDHRETHKPRA